MLDFKQALERLAKESADMAFLCNVGDIPAAFNALDEHVAKLVKKQNETFWQVQEVYGALEENAQAYISRGFRFAIGPP